MGGPRFIGVISAFFKTAIMSMTSPRTLLFSLRRPETPGDARVFAIICGFFWAVSWVLHDYINFKRFSREDFDITTDGEVWVLHFVLALAGTWLLLNVISRLFFKLVSSGDVKAKAPQVLTYNVFAYCLGPSILALIPFYIGPGIALVWIVFLMVYAAMKRLAVKTGGGDHLHAAVGRGRAGAERGGVSTAGVLVPLALHVKSAPP